MIEDVTNELLFDLILTPDYSIDSNFERITSGTHLNDFIAEFPLNIAPPTDDNPFFFHMLRLRDILDFKSYNQGMMNFNVIAVFTLGTLLIIVFVLTVLCIIIPLLLTSKRLVNSETRNAFPLSIFFAFIGLGFMMIEISQMQRLTVFLGHPTYSLSVVLFSLLLSSGVGSYFTERVHTKVLYSTGIRILILLCIIGIFGIVTPAMIRSFSGAVTPIRIFLAVLVLFPMGFFMGMAFPLGLKIASTQANSLTPWFWGINGAMSVFASVLAIAISLSSGISSSFWTGFGCYAVSLIAILWMKKP
jgi:hypothetical protein